MPESEGVQLQGGLQSFDYAMIVAYLVFTFGIAWWFGRKQKTVDDFFVGGRHMPWFAVGLSILATLFSTLSYLGLPGEVIKRGIGLFSGYLALPLTASVISLVWIPFFMRLKLTSAYEYLELRYSYSVRLIGAGLFVCLRLGWMSMVIYAASLALDNVKGRDFAWLPGLDQYWWIVLIGVVAAVYTAVGGIQAMIWTDVLQCLLLLAGVLMAIFYVMFADGTGPVDWWQTATEKGLDHTAPPLFSTNITIPVTIAFAMINNFFWNTCTHGSDQVVLQRYFSTSSLKAARRSYFINLAVDVGMATLLSLAGLALLAFYLRHPEHLPNGIDNATTSPDRLFPHFLGTRLPAGCAGLIIAAFLCDAIQTLESGVNALTAVVTNDLVPRLRRGGKRVFDDLTFARILTIGITVFVTCCAYFVMWVASKEKLNLVQMMPKFFNLFVGPLAAMFIVGMFIPRATTRSIVPAVSVGATLSVLWSWWEQIFANTSVGVQSEWWRNTFGDNKPPSFLLAIAIPCTTTIVLAAILSLILEKRGVSDAGRAYTWLAVVRQPIDTDSSARN